MVICENQNVQSLCY